MLKRMGIKSYKLNTKLDLSIMRNTTTCNKQVLKARSEPTQYRYTVKDHVQSCRFSINEQKTTLQSLASFLTTDDVQDVLHDVQDRTRLLTRCIHNVHDVYTRSWLRVSTRCG